MATRLADTPGGVLIQQDDGSVVTVPPDMADQMVGPVGMPPTPAAIPGSGPPAPVGPPAAPPPLEPAPRLTGGPAGMGGPPAPPAPAPAPAPNPPDAVSGAAPIAPAPAPSPTATPSPGTSPAAAPPPDAFEREEAATLMAGEAAAGKAAADEQILAARNERLAAMQADADKLRADNERRRADMTAKAEAATQAYADHKINEPEPGWGQILAWVLGGIGAALNKSDRNPVIEQWDRMTAENIRRQEADRARLGNLADRAGADLDRFVAHAKDRESAFNYRMAGEAERFARELEVTAQKYGGKTAQANAAAGAAQVRQKGDAYRAAAVERDWQHGQAEAKLELDKFQAAEAVKARKAQIGLGYANLREGQRQFALTQEQRAKEFDATMALRAQEVDNEAAKLEAAGRSEQAKILREQAKEERELAIGGGLALTNPVMKGGKPLADEKGTLLEADGTAFKAPDPVSAQKLRMQVGATVTAAQLLDEMIRLRNAHGWSSDLFKKPEWRQLKSNMSAVILESKNAGELGALSGPDMTLVEGILATKDPTEFRDPTPGLMQARKNMILKTRNALQVARYSRAMEFDVPDMSSPPAATRDRDQESLVGAGARPDFPVSLPSEGLGDTVADQFGIRDGGVPGLTRDQSLGLNSLITRVRAGDRVAVEALANAASSSQNPQARAAASAALALLQQGGNDLAADIIAEGLNKPWGAEVGAVLGGVTGATR